MKSHKRSSSSPSSLSLLDPRRKLLKAASKLERESKILQFSSPKAKQVGTTFIYTWGSSIKGQLGDRSITDDVPSVKPSYVLIEEASPVVFATAAVESTYAICENGMLLAWGSGFLGIERKLNRCPLPRVVNSLNHVSKVAAGDNFALAITQLESQLFSWGVNSEGQCGHGDFTIHHPLPRRIDSLSNVHVQQISCGEKHASCITSSHVLYTWGNNQAGQLGLGNNQNQSTPKIVGQLGNISKVSCGLNHTVCISANKCMYSWGWGEHGRLGTGSDHMQISPQLITFSSSTMPKDISAGGMHTLMLMEDTSLYVCGDNGFGQLGINTIETCSLSPIPLPFLRNIICISAGYSHSAVIIEGAGKVNNSLYMWGWNDEGQLGIGEEGGIRKSPQLVLGLDKLSPLSISLGRIHSCAIVGKISNSTLEAMRGGSSLIHKDNLNRAKLKERIQEAKKFASASGNQIEEEINQNIKIESTFNSIFPTEEDNKDMDRIIEKEKRALDVMQQRQKEAEDTRKKSVEALEAKMKLIKAEKAKRKEDLRMKKIKEKETEAEKNEIELMFIEDKLGIRLREHIKSTMIAQENELKIKGKAEKEINELTSTRLKLIKQQEGKIKKMEEERKLKEQSEFEKLLKQEEELKKRKEENEIKKRKQEDDLNKRKKNDEEKKREKEKKELEDVAKKKFQEEKSLKMKAQEKSNSLDNARSKLGSREETRQRKQKERERRERENQKLATKKQINVENSNKNEEPACWVSSRVENLNIESEESIKFFITDECYLENETKNEVKEWMTPKVKSSSVFEDIATDEDDIQDEVILSCGKMIEGNAAYFKKKVKHEIFLLKNGGEKQKL